MKKTFPLYTYISIFLILLILDCSNREPSEIARATTVCIKNKNFKKIASLYLLPADYTESKKTRESVCIINALALMAHEFGSISDFSIIKGKKQFYDVHIFGGDLDFYKSKLKYDQYVFKTKFSKLGDGYVIIRIYRINGKPKLRSIGYALPKLPKNLKIVSSIGVKLLKLMASTNKLQTI